MIKKESKKCREAEAINKQVCLIWYYFGSTMYWPARAEEAPLGKQFIMQDGSNIGGRL